MDHIVPIDAGHGYRGGQVDLRNHTITMTDASGQTVTMDLGISDVHTDAALSNYINGYKPAEMMADAVSPPVMVNKASNYYYQFDPDNAFAVADGTVVAPGADVPMVSVKLSSTRYATLGYSLGSIIPTEVLANQDAPLNIQMVATRMIKDKLMLNREVRIKTQAFSTANFTSTHLRDLSGDSTLKWNGGSASDPVKDIQMLQEAALMPITDMGMDLATWNAFTRNANVQKFTGFKQAVQGLPTPDQRAAFAAFLNLPRIHVSEARVKNPTTGAYGYVWSSDVILWRRPAGETSDMDIATMKTFRWNGAGSDSLPTEFGGTVTAGWTVRAFFNPFKGPRGSQVIIVTHNDAEQFISQNVGGYIKGAIQ
jgi:hypothetical protein